MQLMMLNTQISIKKPLIYQSLANLACSAFGNEIVLLLEMRFDLNNIFQFFWGKIIMFVFCILRWFLHLSGSPLGDAITSSIAYIFF